MPSLPVVEAVEAHLAENWTALPVKGVNNNEEIPEAATGFLVVQYPVSDRRQITFGSPGNNVMREEGAVRIVINIERGSGLRQGLTWADQIAALFSGKTIAGVRFEEATTPVIDDRNEEGAYFSLAVAVTYQHDTFG